MLSSHGDHAAAREHLGYVEDNVKAGTGYTVHAQAHYQRGRQFMHAGDDPRAIAAFRQALKLRPEAHGYKRPLVQLLAKHGEWESVHLKHYCPAHPKTP